MSPEYVSFSSLIVDDIVLMDGRTFMNTLGGAGTHALVGMRVWSDRLGYVAAVGTDFDPMHRRQLQELGVDLRGLITRDNHLTARAWQLFEHDDRRVEVFRTDVDKFHTARAQLSDLPREYLSAKGFHLHDGSVADIAEVVSTLRDANPSVCTAWEPTLSQLGDPLDEFRVTLALVDLFSPDLGEARTLTGESAPEVMVERMLEWGAQLVAVRMGARGSLVGSSNGGLYEVPAVPTTIVDVTGAGDAYCGGLLVGLGLGEEPALAAARAAVSASFALEQIGAPKFDASKREEAERRLTWARERIRTVDRVNAS